MSTEQNHPPLIKIDKDHLMPVGRFREGGSEQAEMRRAFWTMDIGDSFYWPKDNTHPYLAAKQVGAKITCRKQDKGGWRIWLRAKPTRNKPTD